MVRVIKKQLVKRTLEMLREIEGRPEKDGKRDYDTLWESFGKFIKLGAIEDSSSTCAAAAHTLAPFHAAALRRFKNLAMWPSHTMQKREISINKEAGMFLHLQRQELQPLDHMP